MYSKTPTQTAPNTPSPDCTNAPYDVIIVGGSYAGLSAGLPLARAYRRVLVIDDNQRRNRFGTHSHGFLTQDGTLASEIAQIGKAQLLKYSTVDWVDGRAINAHKSDDGFVVTLDNGECKTARRLILATGVKDILPAIDGISERWGQSVFACPYCHGYELNQGNIGVIATGELSVHSALMLPDWGHTTLLTNTITLSDNDIARLTARKVSLEHRAIVGIENHADIRLADGTLLSFAGIVVAPNFEQASTLGEQLGCQMDDTPLGKILQVSPLRATSIDGVFACGDATRLGGSVTLAVADGTLAGTSAHQSLIFG